MASVMKSFNIITNQPPAQNRLRGAFLYNDVMEKVAADPILSDHLKETVTEYVRLKELRKGMHCESCELEKDTYPMLLLFVSGMKSSPAEVQRSCVNLLGTRTIFSHNEKWIDVATNTVTPFETQTKMLNIPGFDEKTNVVPVKMDVVKPPNTKDEDEGEDEGEAPPQPQFKMVPPPEEKVAPPVVDRTLEPTQASSPTPPTQPAQSAPQVLTPSNAPRKVIFENYQGPGDIVMMTAGIRDLHTCHPGKFITDVRTTSMSIWENNPYVESAKGRPLDEKAPDVEKFRLEYPLIHQSNEGPWHFSEAFTVEMEKVLQVNVDRRIAKGDIHMSQNENNWGYAERITWFSPYKFDPDGDFWIIDAGHKSDFTAKFWGSGKFQEVVDALEGKIQFVQIGHKDHTHPPLKGVINLIGKTDDRQLIRLIWASNGVLTPVSFPMVLSAAIPVKSGKCNGRLERPCVVISGGREPTRWQMHTNHQFIHTCGCLPCCDRGGCWASRVRPIGDGDHKDTTHMCLSVTKDKHGEEVPYCLHMISAEDVVRRIEMYQQFFDDTNRKIYTHNKG